MSPAPLPREEIDRIRKSVESQARYYDTVILMPKDALALLAEIEAGRAGAERPSEAHIAEAEGRIRLDAEDRAGVLIRIARDEADRLRAKIDAIKAILGDGL